MGSNRSKKRWKRPMQRNARSKRSLVAELEEENVLVVPGEIMGLPGHVRLSLTCSDAMVDFALPIFERLLNK